MPRSVGDNTDLPTNSNISKTVNVNIVFKRTFLEIFNKLSNGIQVDRLCNYDSQVIDVQCLWNY